MKEIAPIPKIPSATTTATTIRMILRAPLFFGVVPGAAPEEVKTGAADTAPGWVLPHLLQNFAPASRVAPQVLQNAIASPPSQVYFRRGRSLPRVHISSRVV